jgi:hypothetical protein
MADDPCAQQKDYCWYLPCVKSEPGVGPPSSTCPVQQIEVCVNEAAQNVLKAARDINIVQNCDFRGPSKPPPTSPAPGNPPVVGRERPRWRSRRPPASPSPAPDNGKPPVVGRERPRWRSRRPPASPSPAPDDGNPPADPAANQKQQAVFALAAVGVVFLALMVARH